ncbi:MAG: cyclic nucleotide-binding domain-containing protein [Acidobacteriota bacterium]|jgi:hypothetical protein
MTDDGSEFSIRVRAGDFVFREGDAGDAMFIVQEGEVEIVREVDGRQIRLALLEEGDFFGEMALLEKLPRTASARAATDCLLLRIDESTFDQMIHANPEIPVRMLRKLSQRLRERGSVHVDAPPQVEGGEPPTQPLGAATAAAARLVHDTTGTEFVVPAEGEISVGRFDATTGFQPEVDLKAVDDRRSTSRRHARIACRDGRFFLREEMGTANGTFVGGQRLRPGVEVELRDGDEVRFGFVPMTFRVR